MENLRRIIYSFWIKIYKTGKSHCESGISHRHSLSIMETSLRITTFQEIICRTWEIVENDGFRKPLRIVEGSNSFPRKPSMSREVRIDGVYQPWKFVEESRFLMELFRWIMDFSLMKYVHHGKSSKNRVFFSDVKCDVKWESRKLPKNYGFLLEQNGYFFKYSFIKFAKHLKFSKNSDFCWDSFWNS